MQLSAIRRVAWMLPLAVCTWVYGAPAVQPLQWNDVVPALHPLLGKRGLDGQSFPAYVNELRRQNIARVREGDLDHLIHYVLQSTVFTRLPSIEPAASARAFVNTGRVVPPNARARIEAFVRAQANARDARFEYFREILGRHPARADAIAFVTDQYARAMTFLYDKEFGPSDPALYQRRGLSTDTSVDAGYVVYLALATLRELQPTRRIERALIIGPGLDLAPRTGLLEAGPPQSVQPLAVVDVLVGLRLSQVKSLEVHAVDINPRVVAWIRGQRGKAIRLNVAAAIADTEQVRLTEDYRAYVERFGRAIGRPGPVNHLASGHFGKSIEVSNAATALVDAAVADITVERLQAGYDLIVVTNVFPYLSDRDLLLALTNIRHMLSPGGVLLHNEPRPVMAEAMYLLDLPLLHARSAIIANAAGARSPVYDSIWMHSR